MAVAAARCVPRQNTRPQLDDWIRQRIRMCCWKQWRRVRTKIKNLLALVMRLKTAIRQGVSSKR